MRLSRNIEIDFGGKTIALANSWSTDWIYKTKIMIQNDDYLDIAEGFKAIGFKTLVIGPSLNRVGQKVLESMQGFIAKYPSLTFCYIDSNDKAIEYSSEMFQKEINARKSQKLLDLTINRAIDKLFETGIVTKSKKFKALPVSRSILVMRLSRLLDSNKHDLFKKIVGEIKKPAGQNRIQLTGSPADYYETGRLIVQADSKPDYQYLLSLVGTTILSQDVENKAQSQLNKNLLLQSVE